MTRRLTRALARLTGGLALLGGVGCAWAPSAAQFVAARAEAGAKCQIPLYRSVRPTEFYEELGIIEAYGGGVRGAGDLVNLQRTLELLRKEGCKAGADALIDVAPTTDGGMFIATAIRFLGPGRAL